MTFGLTLLATTTTKEVVCPLCSGTGKSLSYIIERMLGR